MRERLRSIGLSRTETDVAIAVSRGLKNREIAESFNVTEGAVKFQLTNIYKKLLKYGVNDRSNLIQFCNVCDMVVKADVELNKMVDC